MRHAIDSLICSALVLSGACSTDAADDTLGFGTEPTSNGSATVTTTVGTGESGSDSSTSSEGGESSSGAPSSESSSSGGESSTGELVTEPCTSLDVLVVIDNSDTMAEEQAKLTAALGPFFMLLDTQLPGVMGSTRIAVITTDAPEFVTANPTMVCTPYSSGATWIAYGETSATELACASAQGTMGDPDERPIQRALESLAPELQGLGGVNEGFLRDTGPLVVVIVTDEEDDLEALTEWGSEGDPDDWREAFAATQDGHVQDVVPLVLAGIDPPNACPPLQWNGLEGAERAPRLQAFAESFPHHAIGDACAAEYVTFLNGAVPEVVDACNAWVPE
ncbi:MAG: hypothetical protein IAG13_33295 [Deltaproteobacteria bacterium]|nr:hypothetical protein [Nannocystaceae bacterium]